MTKNIFVEFSVVKDQWIEKEYENLTRKLWGFDGRSIPYILQEPHIKEIERFFNPIDEDSECLVLHRFYNDYTDRYEYTFFTDRMSRLENHFMIIYNKEQLREIGRLYLQENEIDDEVFELVFVPILTQFALEHGEFRVEAKRKGIYEFAHEISKDAKPEDLHGSMFTIHWTERLKQSGFWDEAVELSKKRKAELGEML